MRGLMDKVRSSDGTTIAFDRLGVGTGVGTPVILVSGASTARAVHAQLAALLVGAAGLPITKLALWEPPFMTDPDAPRRHQEYVAQLTMLLDAGRRGDA